ncbi:MAG: hypothetical protein CML60_07660 [Rhodobacteraceae bacterium]|nr:hypothetical protein [Paracoccaceae bacterium]
MRGPETYTPTTKRITVVYVDTIMDLIQAYANVVQRKIDAEKSASESDALGRSDGRTANKHENHLFTDT